jgi:Protein of unknown function (DUF3570)
MQLTPNAPIRRALAVATCTLLGTAPHPARADSGDWRSDAAVLYYTEQDRVRVIEPAIFLRKQYADDSALNVRLVYDSMTGASPNGATATNKAQTFTGASGNGSYTTPAGKTPLRDFHDQRIAVAAEWEKPSSRMSRGIYGLNASVESDYSSIGASSTFLRDFNDKLTTLTAGLSVNLDEVSPKGGTPTGLQLLSTVTPSSGHGENEGEGGGGNGKSKTGVDAIIGVTQVLSRRALTQLNYSIGYASGYLTDPYKVVSVIDGTSGETLDYRYEKRPGNRLRQSVYWKTVYHFEHDVVHLSYRYFWDDWGIKANTFDLHYRLELGRGVYLQPHGRYSRQTAADFYHHSLVGTDPVPNYASADYRLGDLTTTTYGLKLGIPVGRDSELSARVESITQSGNSHPADAIGIERNFDLFPTVKTHVYQITYTARF